MNIKSYILSIILIFSAIAAQSQFFVDVYYGYNHSNDPYESVLNEAFDDEFNEQITWRDTTIYYENNDTITKPIVWEYTKSIDKKSHTISFKNYQTFGGSFGYIFHPYFKVNFTLDFIKFISDLTAKATKVTDVYVYGDLTGKETSTISLDYKIINPSVVASFRYPYKGFVPEVYLGYGMYHTRFLHTIKYNYGKINKQVNRYWGNSYGIKAGLGIAYKLNQKYRIFTKLGYSSGNILINKGSVIVKDTEDSISRYSSVRINPDDIPLNNYYSALNSFNFIFGIRYQFSK